MQAIGELIAGSSPGAFWSTWAILSAGALAAIVLAFSRLRRKHMIEGTATSRIRSAAQGYVEFEGRGEWIDDDRIVAPLSGLPCTWYRYKIEQHERTARQGRRESRWREVESGTSSEFFYLIDATGRCVVDPEGARVVPASRDVWYGSTASPQRSPAQSPRWGFGQRYRYTEERLHPGEPLYAIGLFCTTGGAGAALPPAAAVGDLLREWKADRAGLLERFDANRDGEIDMGEWEQARQAAARAVRSEAPDHNVPPQVDLLKHSGDRRRPFILSARSQADTARRLCYEFAGWLTGSLVLAACSASALMLRG